MKLFRLTQRAGIRAQETNGFIEHDIARIGFDAEGDFTSALVLAMRHDDDGGLLGLAMGRKFDRLIGSRERVACRRVAEAEFDASRLVALVENAELVVVAHHAAIDVIRSAAHATKLSSVRPGAGAGDDTKHAESKQSKSGVSINPRTQDPTFFVLQTVERIVANQPFRLIDFFHDFIAGIDARRATDALKLQTVADVYARGADIDAATAIDATACSATRDRRSTSASEAST